MHLRRSRLVVAGFVAAVTFAVSGPLPAGGAPVQEPAREPARTTTPATSALSLDRVLVRFAPGLSDHAAATAVESAGGRLGDGVFGWRVVEAPGRAEEVARRLRRSAGVAAVERDHLRRAAFEPDDPGYEQGYQSYLRQVRLPAGWGAVPSLGAGVTIAVLDSGVDPDHPDLAGARLLRGRDFINVPPDNDPQDDFGHGTMVTGVVAATTNNALGIAGVAGGATILPVKVLDSTGAGSDSAIAAGMAWAVDQGARVLNLSSG